MCACMHAHTYACMCTNMPWRALWGSEDLLKLVLSFCRVGLGDGTWTVKLGDGYLPWVIQRKKFLQKEGLERHVKSGSLPTPPARARVRLEVSFLPLLRTEGHLEKKLGPARSRLYMWTVPESTQKLILPSMQGLPQHMCVPHTHTVYRPSTVREFSAMDAYPTFARIPYIFCAHLVFYPTDSSSLCKQSWVLPRSHHSMPLSLLNDFIFRYTSVSCQTEVLGTKLLSSGRWASDFNH